MPPVAPRPNDWARGRSYDLSGDEKRREGERGEKGKESMDLKTVFEDFFLKVVVAFRFF